MYRVTSLLLVFVALSILACDSTTPTPTYELSARTEPAEAGTVTPSSGTYEEGETVEIAVDPAEGWILDRWKGTESDGNPISVTIDSPLDLTAVLRRLEHSLTTGVEGQGSISEEIVAEAKDDYDHGTQVAVSAAPDSGWRFDRWTGAISGTANPDTLLIDENKSVTAVFERRDFELSVTTEGEGEVSEEVVEEPKDSYPFETHVQLTADPAQGWRFDRWAGDHSGSKNPDTLVVGENRDITAVFQKKTFEVTTEVEGGGEIVRTLISGERREAGYTYNSKVRLEAMPDSGYVFVEWKGDASGHEPGQTITVDTTKQLTAVFERTWGLEVVIEGEGNVVRDPDEDRYRDETTVELTAEPNGDAQFERWEGDLSGSLNPESLEMDSQKSVTAVFSSGPYSIEAESQPGGSTSKTPDKDQYEFEDTVTLEAISFVGFDFAKWTGDIEATNESVDIVVDEDVLTTAAFEGWSNEDIEDSFFRAASTVDGTVSRAEAEITEDAPGTLFVESMDVYDNKGEFVGSVAVGFSFGGFLNVSFNLLGALPTLDEFAEYYVIWRMSDDHTVLSDQEKNRRYRRPDSGKVIRDSIYVHR